MSNKTMEPLYEFTISLAEIHEENLYEISVNIWEDKEVYADQTGERGEENEVVSAGHYYTNPIEVTDDGEVNFKKNLGTIHIPKEHLGAGLVSHEMVHVAFDFFQKVALLRDQEFVMVFGEDDDLEEDLAYTVGYLTKQFWNKFYDLQG